MVHPQSATIPALAACAAHQQGKFEKMEHAIWEKAYPTREYTQAKMEELGKSIGLDVNKFKADMAGSCKQLIQKDQNDVRAVGTSGTPAFYINGRFLSGARPIDQFKKLVDEELKKANDRIGKGEATVANYYSKFVITGGKKKLDPLPAEKPPGK